MKVGIQEDVVLEKGSIYQNNVLHWLEYPSQVTMDNGFRVDVLHALGHFQYLRREVSINKEQKNENHTRSHVSATDGAAFFRHWASVPFSM